MLFSAKQSFRHWRVKLGFFYRNSPYLAWYTGQRNFQLSRLVTNTSVLPSIILGLVAIVVTVIIYIFEVGRLTLLGYEINTYRFIIFSLVVTALITLSGGRYFFFALTPKEYGIFSIKGQRYETGIRYIAYCIWKECSYYRLASFNKHFLRLYQNQGDLDGTPFTHKKFARRVEKQIKQFKKIMSKRKRRIQRIDEMMVAFAQENDIKAHRISDYLFHFSPEIFNQELRNVIRLMEEVLQTMNYVNGRAGQDPNEAEAQRVNAKRKSRLERIAIFFKELERREVVQEEILQFDEMYDFTMDLANNYGMTKAVESYILGYEKIIQEYEGTTKEKQKRVALKKAKFLYHARRMYPGFDVHAILMNIAHKLQNQSLQEFLHTISNVNSQQLEKNVSPFELLKGCGSSISNAVNSLLESSREVVAQKFEQYITARCQEQLKQNQQATTPHKLKLVFVTQGFSSVVNNTIIKFINALIKSPALYQAIGAPRIYVWIVLSPDAFESEDKVKSRYLRYIFKDASGFSEEAKNSIDVNIQLGKKEWVEERMLRKNTDTPHNSFIQSYLLSGAEFFQVGGAPALNNKKEFRYINNENVFNSKEEPSDLFTQRLVLAEGFKGFECPLRKPFYIKAFNDDRLEHLSLYSWNTQRILFQSNDLQQANGQPFENIY